MAMMLLITVLSTAQQFSYKHYTPKDGLAGSAVFQMLQDREGFAWFATNTGLSRFDGTNFKNFSTADGLPGNAIVRMFEDSRGRIWLMPFKNAICFYYQGKIHTQQNDSVLRKINLEDFVKTVAENKNKDLLFTDSKKIYHIDSLKNVSLIGKDQLKTSTVYQVGVRESGEFYLCFDNSLFATDTKTFRFLQALPPVKAGPENLIYQDKMMCWMNGNTLYVESSYYGMSFNQFIGSVNTMFLLSDSMLCLNTNLGTIFYNLFRKKIESQFLTNGNVSHFIADKEGGYWFSTLNDGVYRLSSPVFKSIVGQTAAGQKLCINNLQKFNNEIWAGCDMGHMLQIRNNRARVQPLTVNGENFSGHPVYSITANKNQLAAACGNYIFIKTGDGQFTYRYGYGSSKQVAWKNDKELIVASSNCLYTMQVSGSKKNLIHRMGRATCVYYRDDTTWFGTFEGLFMMKPDASIVYLGKDNELFRNPIVSINEGSDKTLWIATGGSGLIGLQNNKVTWHFGKHNGLSSDKIRCVTIDSGSLWVATEQDLNYIPLKPHPVITRYTQSDGLSSDIINTVLVDKDIVYAGTPEGITWFNKNEKVTSSRCDLKILGITVNDSATDLQGTYHLNYGNNDIRFEYVAISMKSAGNIVYHYRLSGLDTTWKTTTQNSLELISLPPGRYELELYAANRFDVRSLPYRVNIVVQDPFWRTNWFIAGTLLLTALITWFAGLQYNRAVMRKEKARRQAEQTLLDLEQKALRAQMNPHFIFNCLHSIQSFILDSDTEKANKYLSQFASLIRQTLENSLQSFVPLADEIKYLSTYLQLEQMRSESKFEYHVQTEAGLSSPDVLIPVMILQPFVENAVRHGMQSMNGRAGLVNVHFSVNGQELVCLIRDNGIGREHAQRLKNIQPAVYRSRGMQLTHERIELINKNSDKKISVEVIDKVDERGCPNGTDVTIRLPIFAVKDAALS